MVTASVNKKQLGKSLLTALLAVGFIAGGIFGIKKWQAAKADDTPAIKGGTTEEREAYLRSFGYQLDSQSTVTEVTVPESFDSRFCEYNEMLKTLGFDLEPYKGKAVKKCSYTVTAGAPRSGNLTAVLLVYGDEIVGGHLLDSALQRIYPLFEAAQQDAAETLIGTDTEIIAAQSGEQTLQSVLAEGDADALPTAGDGAWPID